MELGRSDFEVEISESQIPTRFPANWKALRGFGPSFFFF